ncbi:hypothetical protein UlMin_008851 [Ulmus minor]
MAFSKDANPSLGYLTQKDTEVKILCPTTVKNESPVPIQITTDAMECTCLDQVCPVGRVIEGFNRARSVQKQALEVDYRNHTLWLKYANFEMKNTFINHAMNVWDHYTNMEDMLGNVAGVRQIFERWINWMPDQQGYSKSSARNQNKLDVYINFPLITYQREGLKTCTENSLQLRNSIEIRKSPPNYDTWFDYIRLEESMGTKERIRKVFERVIANVSPTEEKWYWPFMHLYFVANFLFAFICTINYAIYEELDIGDVEWTRECLKLIPHEKFSFTKIWLLAIFKKFFEIELQLGNIDRDRKLYETYLEWALEKCYAWCKYAKLEKSLLETERMQSIFKLAIAQPILDMLELLWKEDDTYSTHFPLIFNKIKLKMKWYSLVHKSMLLNVKTKLARYKLSCLQFDDDDF